MVQAIKPSGRIALVPLHRPARLPKAAEYRCLQGDTPIRGTVLPVKSWHVYGDEVDALPVGWDYLELRLDEFRQQCAGC